MGAHIWVVVLVFRWARGARLTPTEWALFALLLGSTAGIHALVLGPMHHWIIKPWLF
jgi:hypothetical protein